MTSIITLEQIKEEIYRKHNPSLVIPTESPNGNIIYHIYSDGEITYQKGGWAYLQRSEFTDKYSTCRKNYPDIFPLKRDYKSQNTYGYAIVTEDDANKISLMLSQYDKQQ